jgi:hypothetical protein
MVVDTFFLAQAFEDEVPTVASFFFTHGWQVLKPTPKKLEECKGEAEPAVFLGGLEESPYSSDSDNVVVPVGIVCVDLVEVELISMWTCCLQNQALFSHYDVLAHLQLF